MKQWYNITLPRREANELMEELHKRNIYFEASANGQYKYITMELTESQKEQINQYIQTI
jgi:hypothetical protein